MAKQRLTAKNIIKKLNLVPLPVEGGMFSLTYTTKEKIAQSALPKRYKEDKTFSGAIYYFLTDDLDSFSAMHKLPTDETYHFYLGDPVEMLLLHPRGRSERVILGHDILGDQIVQFTVKRGVWMGSRVKKGGKFALMGTTMAPGFTPSDYRGGKRETLIAKYPDEADLITQLTRPGALLRMTE